MLFRSCSKLCLYYEQGWEVFEIHVFEIQTTILYFHTFEKNLMYFVFKYI